MARRDEGRRQKREDRISVAAGGGHSVWREFQNPIEPLALLGDSELDLIDDTALRILEELGLEFRNSQALDILAKSGADVDHASAMVRFDRNLVRALVAKAPSSFTLLARNPDRNVTMGGRSINFAPVAGPPYLFHLASCRRPATYDDQCNLLTLHHS